MQRLTFLDYLETQINYLQDIASDIKEYEEGNSLAADLIDLDALVAWLEGSLKIEE